MRWELLLVRFAVGLRVLLLGGWAGLLLCGCVASNDAVPLQPHPLPNQEEKREAAAGCNQEIEALREVAASQQNKPCVKAKIIQPLAGICATEGLGRQCISTLDEGTSCLASGPQLPECNRLAKMETQFEQLGAYPLEEVGTTIHENDQ